MPKKGALRLIFIDIHGLQTHKLRLMGFTLKIPQGPPSSPCYQALTVGGAGGVLRCAVPITPSNLTKTWETDRKKSTARGARCNQWQPSFQLEPEAVAVYHCWRRTSLQSLDPYLR